MKVAIVIVVILALFFGVRWYAKRSRLHRLQAQLAKRRDDLQQTGGPNEGGRNVNGNQIPNGGAGMGFSGTLGNWLAPGLSSYRIN